MLGSPGVMVGSNVAVTVEAVVGTAVIVCVGGVTGLQPTTNMAMSKENRKAKSLIGAVLAVWVLLLSQTSTQRFGMVCQSYT